MATQEEPIQADQPQLSKKREINWLLVIFNLYIYVSALCGIHFIIYDAYILTAVFTLFLVALTSLGITAGAHRLWAHQSYKASTGLRIFLMLCHTMAGNGTIYNWVRLHRLHHKAFKTDLDPFAPQKGFVHSFFISGNLQLSPAQEKALEEIDMSDIDSDGVVMFQKRFYYVLLAIVTFLLPINAPVEYWGESILNSVMIVGWLRLAITCHLTSLIPSATTVFDLNADEEKKALDSNLVFFLTKTYWLSYHYLTPWDYQTGEFGKYGEDFTSTFIRVCAALEIATDLKTATPHTIRDALNLSIETKQPIEECLQQVANFTKIPKEHYLMPSKFY